MSDHPTAMLVELASPAQFTGASAAGTSANTDVVTDAHGLPYLPRHRLAARLREGAATAVHADDTLLGAAKRLFGITNGGHEAYRLLRIGHAHPPDPVRAAVAWAITQRAEEHERSALVRAVTEAHTTEESGTEVDADGAPATGRLRTNRVLLAGTRLVAELRWAEDPNSELLRCLARAALATTTAGQRVTRGRGRIDVRLLDPTGERDPHDYTVDLAVASIAEGANR